MSAVFPSLTSRRPPSLLAAVLLALVVGVGGNLIAWTAQRPRPPEEYEDDKKPPEGKRNEDEERRTPKVKHKAIRVEDPPEPAKTPAAGGPGDVDLKTAARHATHPDVKKLFLDLAVPHDEVRVRNNLTGDRAVFVRPLEDYIDDLAKVKTSIKMRTFNNKWEDDQRWNLAPT